MNRIAISMTMLIPPLFLLSLALAQPVSAAPPNGGAAVALPWGAAATAAPDGGFPGSEVVFGECTGSACSAGAGLARVPDPVRAAPLVVNVAPGGLGVNAANVAPDPVRVDNASDLRSADGVQTPIAGEGTPPLATVLARGVGTGSASSLPRAFNDLLSLLLDLVQRAPLPLAR
ncbi:hypothetical protein [Nocardia sp. NPDC049526]|uniref:hypothetical protein n=1 Tax=Nocardia sp. NPDC049526 TaxID=3364316 RepID=UPI0037BE0417